MTNSVIDIAQSENFDKWKKEEEAAFRFTFEKLAETLEYNSFQRYDPTRKRYLGKFLISAYEAIAIGLGYHYGDFMKGKKLPNLESEARRLWTNDAFTNNSGSGVRASARIPAIVPLGRKIFSPKS